jgi:TonB family protein
MRHIFLGLVTGLILFPAASRAQDAPRRACDMAAASPIDSTRPAGVPGVELDKVDPKIAVPACEAALGADPENPRLLYQMGRAAYAAKDDTRARKLYERSAALAHAGAQNNLAIFYENGSGGLPQDDREAARLLKLSADSGTRTAQFGLGYFYETGRGGLSKNDMEAARLYKLAADQGEPHALARLALFYATGRAGFEKSAAEASRLCNLAASKDPTIADRTQCWVSIPRWAKEYASRIAEILERHKRYQTTAYALRQQGTVLIDFKIDRQGQLTDSRVSKSSGWPALDNEALSLLQRSQPFPTFPDNSMGQKLSLSIPVRFDIQPCRLNLFQLGAPKTGCVPVR